MGPFGEPTGAPKGAKGSHFRALWAEKWKCENYAPVGAESSLLKLEGVLRELICITSNILVSACAFEDTFCQYYLILDPIRVRLVILSKHFWLTFGLLFLGFFLGYFLAYFWEGPAAGAEAL